jgi:ubiquinone/menaquinone biosynthesis C-methylase UbiE
MIIISYILLFLLFLVFISALLFLITPLFSLIPFVPVQKEVLNKIVSALELKEDSTLYDLGCGDGRVLFEALKLNPNISCVGIEISPFPFMLAKIKKWLSFSKNIDILYGNFYKINISEASHVFLYLFPEAMDKLLPKFEKELKAGSRVVSCDFEFSKRKPDKVLEIGLPDWQKNKKLYIYNF